MACRGRNASRRKRVRIGIGSGINTVAGAPCRSAKIVAGGVGADGVRLVSQVEAEHRGKSVRCEIGNSDGIGCTLGLLDSVCPVEHVHPIVGPAGFRIIIPSGDVPKPIGFVRVASLGAVIIENDVQADGAGVVKN